VKALEENSTAETVHVEMKSNKFNKKFSYRKEIMREICKLG